MSNVSLPLLPIPNPAGVPAQKLTDITTTETNDAGQHAGQTIEHPAFAETFDAELATVTQEPELPFADKKPVVAAARSQAKNADQEDQPNFEPPNSIRGSSQNDVIEHPALSAPPLNSGFRDTTHNATPSLTATSNQVISQDEGHNVMGNGKGTDFARPNHSDQVPDNMPKSIAPVLEIPASLLGATKHALGAQSALLDSKKPTIMVPLSPLISGPSSDEAIPGIVSKPNGPAAENLLVRNVAPVGETLANPEVNKPEPHAKNPPPRTDVSASDSRLSRVGADEYAAPDISAQRYNNAQTKAPDTVASPPQNTPVLEMLPAWKTDAGFAFDPKPILHANPTTPAATPQDPLFQRPEIPRQIAAQLVDITRRTTDQAIELALNPKELGRVRMALSPMENGISVTITAERGETLDLMRRHIATLEQEFRDIGYTDVRFSFDQQSNNPEGHSSTRDHETQNSKMPAAQEPQTTRHYTLSLSPNDGLDIRI